MNTDTTSQIKTKGVPKADSKLLFIAAVLFIAVGALSLPLSLTEDLWAKPQFGTFGSLCVIATGALFLVGRTHPKLFTLGMVLLCLGGSFSIPMCLLTLLSYIGVRWNRVPKRLAKHLALPVLNDVALVLTVVLGLGALATMDDSMLLIALLYTAAILLLNLSAEARTVERVRRPVQRTFPREGSKLFSVGAVLLIVGSAITVLRMLAGLIGTDLTYYRFFSTLATILLWAAPGLLAAVLLLKPAWRSKHYRLATVLLLVAPIHAIRVFNSYSMEVGIVDQITESGALTALLPIILMILAAFGVGRNVIFEKLPRKLHIPSLNLIAIVLLALGVLSGVTGSLSSYQESMDGITDHYQTELDTAYIYDTAVADAKDDAMEAAAEAVYSGTKGYSSNVDYVIGMVRESVENNTSISYRDTQYIRNNTGFDLKTMEALYKTSKALAVENAERMINGAKVEATAVTIDQKAYDAASQAAYDAVYNSAYNTVYDAAYELADEAYYALPKEDRGFDEEAFTAAFQAAIEDGKTCQEAYEKIAVAPTLKTLKAQARKPLVSSMLRLLTTLGLLLMNLSLDAQVRVRKVRELDSAKYKKNFRGLMQWAYSNVGGGLKVLAKISGVLCLVGAVLSGFALVLSAGGFVLFSVLKNAAAAAVCAGLILPLLIAIPVQMVFVVLTWPLYAQGQVTADVHALAGGAAPAAPAPTEENPDQLPEL